MKILDSNPSLVGNVCYSFTIVSSMVFALAVLLYGSPKYSLFDSLWLQDGFCVSYKELPYWNSHDLCLYGDALFALLLGLVFISTKNEPGMDSCNEKTKYLAFSILGHGIGHGAAAAAMRDEPLDTTDLLESSKGLQMDDKFFLISFLFWISLLRGAMPKSNKFAILGSAILAIAVGTQIDQKLGFTYVQTVLILCNGIESLGYQPSQKKFEYALFALINTPITLIGWTESLACSSILLQYGGHILYDYYIAIASIGFQLICWYRAKNNAKHLKSL